MSVTLNPSASETLAAWSVGTTVIPVGTSVDVKNRFIGTWSRGFEIAGMAPDGYLIRRLSDRSILPDALTFEEVRQSNR